MNVGPWSNLNSFSCKGNEIEIINELYKPKSFIYDEPLDQSKIIKFKNVRDINSLYPYNSLYYSMKRCFEIFELYCKENNIHYDIIIRIRFDSIVTRLPDLNILNKEYIYFSDRWHGTRSDVLCNGMVISTNYKAIQDLMKAYDRFKEYSDDGCLQNDEEICIHVMKKNKHPVIVLPQYIFQNLFDRKN